MAFSCYYLIQMADPVDAAELLAFAKAVEAKSLSRAAAELGVPRATVGRRLARLEGRLGVRLLRRTTRSLALTDAGEALYRHARIALDALRQAEESVRRADDVVRGALRVSLPPLADRGLEAAVCEFARRHPAVRLHAHVSTRHVDLWRDGYDVAVRGGSAIEPGLVGRTLARTTLVAVASPAYLAERGEPRSARDLRRHRCLLGFARGEVPQTHWPLAGGGKVRVEGALASNELALLREAALRGLGVALLPEPFVAAPLARGELVRVLAGVVESDSRFVAVYPEREFVPPQVRAFVDAMVAWARSDRGGAGAGAGRGARAVAAGAAGAPPAAAVGAKRSARRGGP
jgi:DNA-binding transcriptional LysR family regulator